MDCSCDVYVDGDGYPAFYNDRTHKARKDHKCCECRRIIKPGETYSYCSGLWDGKFGVYKTCLDCMSVRDAMFTNGWNFGNVWDDVYEHISEVGGDVPESCIADLSPVAREKVIKIIEQYHEDD